MDVMMKRSLGVMIIRGSFMTLDQNGSYRSVNTFIVKVRGLGQL